jgi:methyl-accepting chemotaxis protein
MNIRGKLLIGFMIGAVITATLGGIGIFVMNQNQTATTEIIEHELEMKDRARQMEIGMLEARRSEKDYLLRSDWKYVDSVGDSVTQIKQNAAWIRDATEDDQLRTSVISSIDLAETYESQFRSVAESVRTKGQDDLGIIGAFRAKTHDVEARFDELGVIQLSKDLLEIRRSEKDYLLRGSEKYIAALADNIAVIKDHLSGVSIDEEAKTTIITLLEEYHVLFGQVVSIDQEIEDETAIYRDTVHAIEPLIHEIINASESGAQSEIAAMNATTRTALIIFVITMISGVIIAIILGLYLSTSISTPLKRVVEQSEKIAEGDLSLEKINSKSKDELGTLAGSFGTMLDSLNNVMSNVNVAVDQVTSGSNQVSQASQSLSQGATEQASSLEEITSSLNEINGQSKQNAENAAEAKTIANTAVENAETGNTQMQNLGQLMEEINVSSNEIKKVVKVIDDIAFQINLLALNANVEAARAGKYGKGFAVVADEVRNLAVRSADAVKETTQIVEDSTKRIDVGVKATEDTATQLDEIVTGSRKVAEYLGEITVASDEQAQGVEQINDGLQQIDLVTQGNTASAEEAASAAEELAAQAQQLSGLVAQFTLAKNGNGNGNGHHLLSESLSSLDSTKRETVVAIAQAPVFTSEENRQPDSKKVINLDDEDFGKF